MTQSNAKTSWAINATDEDQALMHKLIQFTENYKSVQFTNNPEKETTRLPYHNFSDRFDVFHFAVVVAINQELVTDHPDKFGRITKTKRFMTSPTQSDEGLTNIVEKLFPMLCSKFGTTKTLEILGHRGLKELSDQIDSTDSLYIKDFLET